MRILMLGWEFPPFISGGLGTACHGLTRALDALGHEVLFVLPKSVDRSAASHVRLLTPELAAPGASREQSTGPAQAPIADEAASGAAAAAPESSTSSDGNDAQPQGSGAYESPTGFNVQGLSRAAFFAGESDLKSVYSGSDDVGEPPDEQTRETFELGRREIAEMRQLPPDQIEPGAAPAPVPRAPDERAAIPGPGLADAGGGDYEGDVIETTVRYARTARALAQGLDFDVIHAHDWMTYPAGLAIARATGKPLVAHIHSCEFDRSGEHVDHRIFDIERRGLHGAMKVIAVSQLTKSIVTKRYGVDEHKVHVVYNGVEPGTPQPGPDARIGRSDKIVLYLGRITFQKGPEYFVEAAKRVLEKMSNVKFVVAGSGDMARRMIELAAELGIGHKVLFTGFLRGDDVPRVFRMADCYVMPSVSEPFGIAPLEAMSHDTPVIISKQSGVSEVLTHALKVDFWNVEEIADRIVNVLTRPPLHTTLRQHAPFEIKRLTWERAATHCLEVYEQAATQMAQAMRA